MERSWYSFDVSPGWVFVAILAAFGLALLLYSKQGVPWSKSPNFLMGFLRFSAIFLILLLLLNPLLQLNTNEVEKPVVVFALDNSESLAIRSGNQLDELKRWLAEAQTNLTESYETTLLTLSPTADSIAFNAQTSNLDELLSKIENVYQGRNVGAVVFISDGIVTRGQSPEFRHFSFPVYTLGMGDTIPPRDIAITSVRNNRIAYQGNQFPVSVFYNQTGYNNEPITVTIREGNAILKSETTKAGNQLQDIQFLIDAKESGLKRLTVEVAGKEGESSYVNNRQDIYVDIVEGREKVLIMAPAPHPDLTAIRSTLHDAANYETVLYIPGINQPPGTDDFDVVIEHQAFSGQRMPEYASSGKWYILGSSSSFTRMSQELGFLTVLPKGRQMDMARPHYSGTFTKFRISEDLLPRLKNYPPLEVPFGEYNLTGPSESLLQQQIGSIPTDRPLFSFFDDGTKKAAVLLGTGIWQWKLQEAGSENEATLYREIILKTIQFLSVKAGKDRFVVTPRKTEYLQGDRVFLDTEVYNDIYERTYGNTIELRISNESGETTAYQMVDDPANSSFNLGSLEAGAYEFQATTTVGAEAFTETGAFAVKDVLVESIDLTANHNLLRAISYNTGGQFFSFPDRIELSTLLNTLTMENVLHTNRSYFPLINSIWIILLIALFLCTEWFLRKYLGAY